ncbi:hypothetical protein Pfo_005828 [Paulownia fortunei]|nr:hypothetical protein Pfo_005828 [Paulownia fortunei]
MPYAEGGVTCIVPIKYEDANDVLTFLEPLTKELWLTTAIFYISTALAVWILANRIVSSSRDSPGQHVGMICYFPFFPGEGIEANLLCLILVAWAFVASLLNSTYTASLSTRLTLARLQPTVTDVTQLIKNGEYFLIKLGFDESKIRTYKSADDCDEALSLGSKNGGISAYYDVLPHIRLLLSQYCGKYRMAFPKGSPAIADISRAIIQLTEHGTILEIEQRLSSNPECSGPDSTSSPTSVTLRSFLALFAITGFVTLTCLVVSLLMYLHNKRSFLQRISEFNANTSSRIIALRKYFKQNNPSSLPKTTNTRDEIPRS